MSIIETDIVSIPQFFQKLIVLQCISPMEIDSISDGFYVVRKSIASILISKRIETVPGKQDQPLECRNYFDDWYIYAVPGINGHTYSLFKMREQEYDAENGFTADGDTPGVTISFIAFDTGLLERCLQEPDYANREALGNEINRVVAYRKQVHHPDLKAYFIRPEAEGAYLVAELYTKHIASFASSGTINVPKAYSEMMRKRGVSAKYKRLPDFIDANNATAGRAVCDHEKIYLQNTSCLTKYEKLAILATHTGNVSFHSFAAEVRYHAQFLVWYAKVSIPFVGGSPYASAVRADMTIADKEFEGPAPFYDLDSKLVREQMRYHKDL